MQLSEKQCYIKIAFTEDGKTLVSNAGLDPFIRFWDVKTGKQERERLHAGVTKEILAIAHGGAPKPVLFVLSGLRSGSADDGRAGSQYFCRGVCRHGNGDFKAKLDISGRGACTFSEDGKLIATCEGLVLKIWNTQTGRPDFPDGRKSRTRGNNPSRTRSNRFVSLTTASLC